MLNWNTPYISLILRNYIIMAGDGKTDEDKVELIQEVWPSANTSPLEPE